MDTSNLMPINSNRCNLVQQSPSLNFNPNLNNLVQYSAHSSEMNPFQRNNLVFLANNNLSCLYNARQALPLFQYLPPYANFQANLNSTGLYNSLLDTSSLNHSSINANKLNAVNFNAATSQFNVVLRMLISEHVMGAVFGKNGNTIRNIAKTSHSRIYIHRSNTLLEDEKIAFIIGTEHNNSIACNMILEVIHNELKTLNKENDFCLKLLAFNDQIGRVIGKNGKMIESIRKNTKTFIAIGSKKILVKDPGVSFNDTLIIIKGNLEDICKAEKKISEKLNQNANKINSYELLHPSLSSNLVYNPATIPTNSHHFDQQTEQLNLLNQSSSLLNFPASNLQSVYFTHSLPLNDYNLFNPLLTNQSSNLNTLSLDLQDFLIEELYKSIDNSKEVEVVYIHIPCNAVGALIGRGGSSIREIISTSGASIKVSEAKKIKKKPDEKDGNDEKSLNENHKLETFLIKEDQKINVKNSLNLTQPVKNIPKNLSIRKVIITGTTSAQWKAQKLIYQMFVSNIALTIEIHVPKANATIFTGKDSNLLNEIQAFTNTHIKIDWKSDLVKENLVPILITGYFFNTQAAQRQIKLAIKNRLDLFEKREKKKTLYEATFTSNSLNSNENKLKKNVGLEEKFELDSYTSKSKSDDQVELGQINEHDLEKANLNLNIGETQNTIRNTPSPSNKNAI